MKLLEDRDDLRHQVFVHDEFTAVGLAVETEVVDLDPPQPPRLEGATGPPARAEIGGGDRVNDRSGRWLAARWRRAASAPTVTVWRRMAVAMPPEACGGAEVHCTSTAPTMATAATVASRW